MANRKPSVEATLDSQAVTDLYYDATDFEGHWLAFLTLNPGSHTLNVNAFTNSVLAGAATNTFASLGTAQTASTTWDVRGYAVKRTFVSNGSQQQQTLTWDGAWRLTAVSQRDLIKNPEDVMKTTQKHEIESVAAGRGVRGHLLAGLLVVCGGLAAVLAADGAPPLDTTPPTSASSSSDLPEPLPLMVPGDVWKRLTLTAEQQSQLTALRTRLYRDQLRMLSESTPTVRSITLHGETLRLALIEARDRVPGAD